MDFNEYPSVPHRHPQFNTSVPHKDHTFSAPARPQFTPKSRSSIPKTSQFHTKNPLVQYTPQFQIKNFSVQHQDPLSCTHPSLKQQKPEGFFSLELGGVLNRRVFGVELRGFWCGTEGCVEQRVLLWNWRFFGVELRGCVELRDFWCGTEGF